MSSASIAQSAGGVLGAWETAGQVYYADLNPATVNSSAPMPAPGAGEDRKHPRVARNAQGETILVWDEGTGWNKGGALAWQVFDSSGRPTEEKGRIERGIPVWSFAAVVARPDGGFTILY
jgi:hypothetical protein